MQLPYSAAVAAKILGKAGSNAIDTLNTALAGFDPAAATDVDIDRIKNSVIDLSKRFIAADAELKKDHDAVENIRAEIAKNMRALGILKTKADTLAPDAPEHAAIMDQAAQLNDTIGQLDDQEKTAREDEDEVNKLVSAIKQALDDAQAKLGQAERQRGKTIHDLEMAKLANERATARLERAKQIEQLRASSATDTSGISRAAAAAAKIRQNAEAANLAAESIEAASGSATGNLADKILTENAPPPPKADPFARLSQHA